jgi:hypothetical protein
MNTPVFINSEAVWITLRVSLKLIRDIHGHYFDLVASVMGLCVRLRV